MAKQLRMRQRFFDEKQKDLGSVARDVQDLLGTIPVVELRIVESLYKEPLAISTISEEPFGLELVRIVNLFAPKTPVSACTGIVHWVWLPEAGGASITQIGGLTPAANGKIKYRFYFRVTYKLS